MNKENFLALIKDIDSLKNNESLLLFIWELYFLLDYWIDESEEFHLESSFNSNELEKIVKVIQVFKFDKMNGEKLIKMFNLKPLRKHLSLLNQRQGSNFNLDCIDKISKMDIWNKKDNDFFSLNFDFDIDKSKIEKVSVYFNTDCRIFGKIFGVSFFQEEKFQENLELIGIDLSSDGKIFLKTYRQYDGNIEDYAGRNGKEKKMIINKLDKLGSRFNYHFMLLLDKVEVGKKRWKFGGCYLYCENNDILALTGKDFKLTTGQRKLFDFTKGLIKKHHRRLSFFVLKPEDVLEIYFL